MLAIGSRRPLHLLALVAVVTLLHAWLLDGRLRPLGDGGTAALRVNRMVLVAVGEPPAPRAGPDRPRAVPGDDPSARTVAPPDPAPAVSPGPRPPVAPLPPTGPAPAADVEADSTRAWAAAVPVASAGTTAPSAEAGREVTEAPPVVPAGGAPRPLPPEALARITPAGSASVEAVDAGPQDASGGVDGLRHPPDPALAASAPFQWAYRVSRGTAQGDGELQWTPAGHAYELRLRAAAPGAPTLDWISRGQVGIDGLAPERMVERQRDRETQAVNFQRDKGLISFSGPSRTEPLLPGAQDRLSWIVQVAAQARARGELRPGDLLRFQVASPRGDVDEWRFVVQPAIERLISGQRVVLTHLLREPQRPHDLRVQLWLSRQFDQLPVGMAWAVEPDGVPLEMWLTALPVNY